MADAGLVLGPEIVNCRGSSTQLTPEQPMPTISFRLDQGGMLERGGIVLVWDMIEAQ
jgi:hypothetical protein